MKMDTRLISRPQGRWPHSFRKAPKPEAHCAALMAGVTVLQSQARTRPAVPFRLVATTNPLSPEHRSKRSSSREQGIGVNSISSWTKHPPPPPGKERKDADSERVLSKYLPALPAATYSL